MSKIDELWDALPEDERPVKWVFCGEAYCWEALVQRAALFFLVNNGVWVMKPDITLDEYNELLLNAVLGLNPPKPSIYLSDKEIANIAGSAYESAPTLFAYLSRIAADRAAKVVREQMDKERI